MLTKRHALRTDELSSLNRLLVDELDVSIVRLLGESISGVRYEHAVADRYDDGTA